MTGTASEDEHRPHKVWADAEGTVHKCEWLKVGDRKVPVAVTLCGQQTPPQASEVADWTVTCEACNNEIAARHARLVQA
ncbi:hypothetical protein [Emcibacter sp. SYSU 3D8]|uniref:hypothetical protein n=1 Tax=Emcibacter sp. SYSU 3D8 TaxID=3133969 RepID=UPI0031FEF90C